MNILFIHQNFPGQYLHLVQYLHASGEHNIVGIGEAENIKNRGTIHGITTYGYPKPKGAGSATHHYLKNIEAEVRRGQNVVRSLLALRQKGFEPDVICAHPGWGEALFVRDVFPNTPILMFCEFYFMAKQADLGFDPEFPRSVDWEFSVRLSNTSQLISINAANLCYSPTWWQASRYPAAIRERIRIVHDGIDTTYMHPKKDPHLVIQPLKTPGESRVVRANTQELLKTTVEKQELAEESYGENIVLTKESKVITYMARNLEPYRGFHTFMRTLPLIQEAHPDAEILIVGGDSTSYSPELPGGQTYKAKYLEEMRGELNLRKIHFLGKVPYLVLREMFCLSKAHLYLTYPFVLSWSVLEAMSCQALVIASDTAPVQEVITNGQNGILVNFFEKEKLAAAVNHALSSPKDYGNIRLEARRTVQEKFDMPKCLAQHAEMISDLANGKYPL